jgi:hypothetical protein
MCLPRISHGVGRGMARELAVEFGEHKVMPLAAQFRAGRGERGILRRGRAVDDGTRARKAREKSLLGDE